jgi:hypothetical protein
MYEKSSTSFSVMEMLFKSYTDSISTQSKWPQSRKQITNAGENVREKKLLFLPCGRAKTCRFYENQHEDALKIKNKTLI